MRNFKLYERNQPLLMPMELREWVADDDLAHFIVEAAERIDITAFHVSATGSGKAQYHPRMMLALY
jgi:transposase